MNNTNLWDKCLEAFCDNLSEKQMKTTQHRTNIKENCIKSYTNIGKLYKNVHKYRKTVQNRTNIQENCIKSYKHIGTLYKIVQKYRKTK